MTGKNTARNLTIILITFGLSRGIFYALGIRFDMTALADYWQYLDIESLKTDVLKAIWYQPAQPPVFNLLLSAILKVGGAYASTLYCLVFCFISLANACILQSIISRATANSLLALVIPLVYLLSPSTVLLENELFYTSFVSLLLLLTVYNIQLLQIKVSFTRAFLVFLLLAILCLTRSFYHLGWMLLTIALLLIHWWPAPGVRKIALAAIIPVCLVSGWYAKNLYLFGNFSTTSWGGMSLARIVFHEKSTIDTTTIAGIPPFSAVSSYRNYLTPIETRNIPDKQKILLTKELKNGEHLNLFNIHYIGIAEKYGEVSKKQIRQHPSGYLKNLSKTSLIFFTPASSYFKVESNERKIRFYDAVLTLNFASFFQTDREQKKSLAVSAIVVLAIWLVVLNGFRKEIRGFWQFPAFNFFILTTIAYVFLAGTLLEYGENMRFRYEVQPLFLILVAQFISWVKMRRTIPSFRI